MWNGIKVKEDSAQYSLSTIDDLLKVKVKWEEQKKTAKGKVQKKKGKKT